MLSRQLPASLVGSRVFLTRLQAAWVLARLQHITPVLALLFPVVIVVVVVFVASTGAIAVAIVILLLSLLLHFRGRNTQPRQNRDLLFFRFRGRELGLGSFSIIPWGFVSPHFTLTAILVQLYPGGKVG